jgi:hypothetical protein
MNSILNEETLLMKINDAEAIRTNHPRRDLNSYFQQNKSTSKLDDEKENAMYVRKEK